MVAPLQRNTWSDPNVCDTIDGKNTIVYRDMTETPEPMLTLTFTKIYLRIEASNTIDDELITFLIDVCTEWGELYTGRDFRAKEWGARMDCFVDRPNVTELRRDLIVQVTAIKYINKENALITIPGDVYYLKKMPQTTQILLQENKEWPSDIKEEEQKITIEFQTEPPGPFLSQAKLGVLRHIAYMFENHGDCGSCKECSDVAGVKPIFDQFRIVRV